MIETKGNSVIVETPDKTQYMRNVTEVKKFITEDKPIQLEIKEKDPQTTNSQGEVPTPTPVKETPCQDTKRPTRYRKAPDRFGEWA